MTEPNDDTWTIDQVAEHLGLTRAGARSTMRNWNIEPVARQPGRSGLSLYRATEVRAAHATRPGRGSRTDTHGGNPPMTPDEQLLRDRAAAFTDWLCHAVQLRGLDLAVIDRRWIYPGEMTKLVESTERNPNVASKHGQWPEQAAYFHEAKDDPDALRAFLSAAARHFYLTKYRTGTGE